MYFLNCSYVFPSTLPLGLSSFLQRKSDLAGNITPPHTSTSSSIDHEQASPACGLQPCSNGQQESKQDVGLAVVTIENCITTTKDHRGPPLLEDKTRGADSTVVTQTSCASGSLCQSQEAGGEQKGAPAANSPARRNRKNKKRTTRNATESLENKRCTQEGGRGIARRPTKTPRSRTEIHETISVRQPAGASVIGDREATKTQCSPGTEETPLPIKPVTAPGGDRKCAGRKTVALPTTTIIEKQEGEKWEVDLLICERVVETETEQGDPAKAAKFNLGSAAEKKGTFITVLRVWGSVTFTQCK